MRTNVADAAGNAAPGRVGTPVGLFVAGTFEQRRQPTLVVLDDYFANFPELTVGDHVPCLTHQRVAGVIVGNGENDAGFFGNGNQILRLFRSVHQRLVADDIDASRGERFSHRIVQVIGGDDADEIDALARRATQFVFQQRLPGRVITVIGQPQLAPRSARLVRVRRKRTGDQLHLPVERHGLTMYATYESALAATDHRVTQLFHDLSPSCAEFAVYFSKAASKATPDGLKSSRRQNAALSVAPCTRSMRLSSHSTESGPW